MVRTLPAAPVAVQGSVRVVVVPPSEIDVAPVALYVLVIVLKVLLPPMVNSPAPPWFRVMPEYERPPPVNCLPLPFVRLIVPEPVTVMLEPDTFHGDPNPENVHVPEPIAIVLDKVPVEEKAIYDPVPAFVTLYPDASKVPARSSGLLFVVPELVTQAS